MFKRVVSLLSLIVSLLLFVGVGGIYASWTYASSFVEDLNTYVGVDLLEFEFAPEEILPDDEEADQAGENHVALINNVVDHITYGLNSTSKPIVNDLLQSGTALVYSQQNVQGGNLKHLLLDDANVEKLDFVVEYVSDTEYACYTFSSSMLTSSNSGKSMQAYKTKIVYENGKWDAVLSYEGKATIARVTVKNSSFMSILVSSWEKV